MRGTIILAYLNFFLWLHLVTVFLWVGTRFIRKSMWREGVMHHFYSGLLLMWCTWLNYVSLTCCSSFLLSLLHSSSFFWLQRDGHGEGEGQMISHDVISQGFRRTSALSTAVSFILLNNTKHGLWCRVFTQKMCAYVCVFVVPTYLELFTGEHHRWMMRSYIPCSHRATRNTIILFAWALPLYCSSLCWLFTGQWKVAWRDRKTQEKNSVSGHCTTRTLTLHTHTLISNSCQKA